MTESFRHYRDVNEFEPLLPERGRPALEADAAAVVQKSIGLAGAGHASTVERIRELVRSMNSYYSNRIEGQGTHPLDIERAMRSDYSDSPERARLQRLARAHIEAEASLEQEISGISSALRFAFLRRAHGELYSRLPAAERFTTERSGVEPVEIVPGALRTTDVHVGRHIPPQWDRIEVFGRRFDAVYGRDRSFESSIVAVAAAHHRASWIHPFRDGNGRAVRLQTHCALFPVTAGLWSVSRGLARKSKGYYAHLDAADAPRAGDLDGRGNLSERALHAWCEWFIAVCDDQVTFMTDLLRLDTVRTRFRSLIGARAAIDTAYRVEVVAPWFHAFAVGPIGRGEFQKMTGLNERTARAALAKLLDAGLLTSGGHRDPVRVAFPLDALQLLFPDLYPEAAAREG